jgi:amino acid adenylation domain-containing protein
MDPRSLTKFPCLEEMFNVEIEKLSSISVDIEFADETQLCQAWALILMSYTGQHQVSFLFDDDQVQVDSAGWIIQRRAHDSDDTFHHPAFTRISMRGDGKQGSFALELLHDLEGGLVLRSCGHVPKEHIEGISQELGIALDWFTGDFHAGLPVFQNESLQKAILNPVPAKLDGPTRLEALIDFERDGLALEWLDDSDSEHQWTYKQLGPLVFTLAESIQAVLTSRERSAPPIIAIILPQCPSLYIAQLAVLRLGCAFCPIHPDTPLERTRFILNDTKADVVIALRENEDKLPLDLTVSVLRVDTTVMNPTSSSGQIQPVFQATPEDTAYIMYTSGSTGFPKGVPIGHLAVTQSLLAHEKSIPRYNRFLQFAAPTFDVSIFEIFFTFFRGATLVCCHRPSLLNDVSGTVNRMGIDAMELTPSVAGSLVKSRTAVPGVKLLLTIGEMLTESVIHEFGGHGESESILWAMYGPTEAAIHCTLQPRFDSRFRVNHIGRPLETVSSFVLRLCESNEVLNEITKDDIVAVGHVGELVVGGPQLTLGYLNKPDQTAAAIIPSSPWGPLYRTGDKARMLPNGTLECLGRASAGQVKLRGQRFELGEVEKTSMVVDGCPLAVAEVIGGILVLFCQVTRAEAFKEVQACCERWLPSYMVPGDFIQIKDMPYLPSGKVDRRRLKELYSEIQSSMNAEGAPDAESNQIIGFIEEVVGHSVSLELTLSAASIDSLTVIRLIARLAKAGYSASALSILKCNRIRDICDMIDLSSAESIPSQSVEVVEPDELVPSMVEDLVSAQELSNVQSVCRCTPTQIAMLAETLRSPTAYWNTITLEVHDPPNLETIVSWIEKLLDTHSILRSGFLEASINPDPFVQVIWKISPSDVIHVGNSKPESYRSSLSFPFSSRIVLDGDIARLTIKMHHAIYDGWSLDLLVDDLNRLAVGMTLDTRASFRSVQTFYTNHNATPEKEFWQRHLGDCISTSVANRLSNETERKSISFQMDVQSQSLRTVAATLSVSPQVFLQSALFLTLAKTCGMADLTIAMVTAGRTIPVAGIETAIGPCLNTLPMRINVSYSETVADLNRYLQSLNREILQNSSISLRDIKRAANILPDTQLTDVIFIWQESISSTLQEDKVKLVGSTNQTEFKLLVEIDPAHKMLQGRILCQSAAFTEHEIQSLLESFKHNLSTCVGSLDMKVQDICGSALSESKPATLNRQTGPPVVGLPFLRGAEEISETENDVLQCIHDTVSSSGRSLSKSASIFRYGVDSISAIQIARSLRDKGYANASISLVMQNPTAEKLAAALSRTSELDSRQSVADELIPASSMREIRKQLVQKDITAEKILPCTPLQEAMVSHTLGQEDSGYVTQLNLVVHGNVDHVRSALAKVLQRHNIFKTGFFQSNLKDWIFVQVVRSMGPEIISQTEQSEDLEDTEFLEREIMRRLKANEPPIVARILSTSKESFLQIGFHHALYDATAVQSVICEVEAEYAGYSLAEPVSPISFLKHIALAQSAASVKFWSHSLKNFQPNSLAIDSGSMKTKPRSNLLRLCMPLSTIEANCRRLSCTLSTFTQAVLTKVLFQLTKTSDLCFGNIVDNRDADYSEPLVFPTFNTIPIHINLEDYISNQNLIDQLQSMATSSKPHNLVSLRQIHASLDLFDTRLFFCLLILQTGPLKLDSRIWELESESGNIDASSSI